MSDENCIKYCFKPLKEEQETILQSKSLIWTILNEATLLKRNVFIDTSQQNSSLKALAFTPSNFIQVANKIVRLEINGYRGNISIYDLALYRGVGKITHSLKEVVFRKSNEIYSTEIHEGKDTINELVLLELASCFHPAKVKVDYVVERAHGFGMRTIMMLEKYTFTHYFYCLKSRQKLKYVFMNDFLFPVLRDEFYFKLLARVCYGINELRSFQHVLDKVNVKDEESDKTVWYLARIMKENE